MLRRGIKNPKKIEGSISIAALVAKIAAYKQTKICRAVVSSPKTASN